MEKMEMLVAMGLVFIATLAWQWRLTSNHVKSLRLGMFPERLGLTIWFCLLPLIGFVLSLIMKSLGANQHFDISLYSLLLLSALFLIMLKALFLPLIVGFLFIGILYSLYSGQPWESNFAFISWFLNALSTEIKSDWGTLFFLFVAAYSFYTSIVGIRMPIDLPAEV